MESLNCSSRFFYLPEILFLTNQIILFICRHGDYTKNATCGYDHEHHEEKQDFLKHLEDNKVPDIANHIDGLEFNRILRVSVLSPSHNQYKSITIRSLFLSSLAQTFL